MNNTPPIEITTTEAAQLSLQHYGFQGQIKKLPGEEDFNFFLKTETGETYTIKISRPNTELQFIQFQSALMNHLAARDIPLDLPSVVLSKSGKEFIPLKNDRYLRIQKWVSGTILSEVKNRDKEILENWGKTCGLLSTHLADFDHPAAHRFYKWDPSQTLYSKKYRAYIQDEETLEIADYFWQLFETDALPYLDALRKSVNYNDAHEHNFLVHHHYKNPQVIGVIDFGDALFTQTINELAIACAYAAMYVPDPLQAITHVVRGYHKVFPLEEKEVAVLFPLIAARLMVTVSSAAWNRHNEPDNPYLLISEKPAWDLLKKIRNIPPSLAHYTFRNACQWEACPLNAVFRKWLAQHPGERRPILRFHDKKLAELDLSVGSSELGHNNNFETIPAFAKKINQLLEEKSAAIGIGGYGETRPFYTTDAYLVNGNSGPQWRTVHLGIDLWSGVGTSIYAPFRGSVHSVQNNDKDRDYGATIILQHNINKTLTFYTLYGHLSLASIEDIEAGMFVEKGQLIATIGRAPENGNWPPHLHFQIMLDLLENRGDFPGVAFPNEAEVWKSICPDPAPLFPLYLKSNPKKSLSEIMESRKKHLGSSLSISYPSPLHIVRGYQQYLYDETGRRYLDTANNVAHVGHQHSAIVEAAQNQISLLNTNTRYLHENIVNFAEELLETFPPELSVVHFVNSGSEANELAMRMIEAYTNQKDMIAIEVGYHGNTGRAIDVSSYKFDGKGGKGAPPHTHLVPIPDTFRGLYRDPKTAGKMYADHVVTAIKKVASAGRIIGGFICESVLSCGGQIVLPKGYLKTAYAHVRAVGGLCVADEVQVGFGRVGEYFWGFELQDVVPDIVTLGKPIGNGHPLAAVVTTQKVATAFANGMEFFNTFGGNPVSCAIGAAVLKTIKKEGLQTKAKETGNYLLNGFKKLQTEFPIIGDVRGHGLFLGIELVNNMETLEPAAEETAFVANCMRERGILMSTDGPFHNVLKIKPPMCFGKAEADFLLAELRVVLGFVV